MFLKKFGSFLLALWAGFLRFMSDPEPQPQKEATVPNFYSPEELREKLKERAFQLEMVDWVKTVLRPLENDALYLMVCRDRGTSVTGFTTLGIKAVMDRMDPAILLGTPAHDLGHHICDALGGAALISNDSFLGQAHRNELDAAFWAAMYHDCFTGIQHRYVDTEWDLNHAEGAAWYFYHATEDLIIEPIRRLAAYMIAVHPHMLKKMEAKNGSERLPWNDQLFFYGSIPVRIGVWITRWTDRLENGGDAATHFVRHAMATVDGALVGGLDLHGVDWYTFNDQLRFLFTPKAVVTEITVLKDGQPVLKDGQPVVNKVPSMLQHLKGYATSALAFPYSPYNQHDHRSPVMSHLMGWKVANSGKFIDLVTNTTGTPNFETFVQLMKIKSGKPNSQITLNAIEMLRELWKLNSAEDQAHWAQGFDMALASYHEWLKVLQIQISLATDPTIVAFQPLVPNLIARITQI